MTENNTETKRRLTRSAMTAALLLIEIAIGTTTLAQTYTYTITGSGTTFLATNSGGGAGNRA
jgi:hypothetical protein